MNYYNEYDPKAAAWLRTLIEYDLIPEGEVDERSIKDVDPWDLHGFTQCHFFCGIGGWPLALQLAGVSADTPLWTGSCPCQAFSTAGKQLGFADERDLWPTFFNLIRVCRPPVVLGEQVAAAIGHGWLDRVYHDLEGEGYACGAAVLGACSVGAPHKRERLYWGGKLADTDSRRRASFLDTGGCTTAAGRGEGDPVETDGSADSRMEHAGRVGPKHKSDLRGERGQAGKAEGEVEERQRSGTDARGAGTDGGVADSFGIRCGEPEQLGAVHGTEYKSPETLASNRPVGMRTASFWSDSIPILCRDGKTRRIPASAESVLLGLVDGLPTDLAGCDPRLGFPLEAQGVKNRAVMLKGLGNAVVVQVAAEFIKAFLDTAE